MSPRDMICDVTVSDGSTFRLYACVRGSIIEINRRLIDEPQLLSSDPLGQGYVAVLLPKLAEKAAIGRACVEFDTEAPLAQASSNEKRRLEGKTVRTNNKDAKRAKKWEDRSPCWDYQKKGACKFGDNCRFAHPGSGRDGARLAAARGEADDAPQKPDQSTSAATADAADATAPTAPSGVAGSGGATATAAAAEEAAGAIGEVGGVVDAGGSGDSTGR